MPVTIRNTMQVKSLDEKRVYLKNQVIMSQDYTLKFSIPSYEKEVLITYGSIRDTLDATPDIIYFNYLSQ